VTAASFSAAVSVTLTQTISATSGGRLYASATDEPTGGVADARRSCP
jgi:hypothetical protein